MELKNFFAQDDQGNLLGGATCYLYARGTENLAAGLQAANGTALTNPFTADAKGLIQFAAPNGLYDLRVVKGPRDYRVRVQCVDVQESVADAEAAAGRAEGARDAVLAGSNIYPDVSTGLASVSVGQFFKVVGSGSIAANEFKKRISPNLFNTATIRHGYYLNSADGLIKTAAGWGCSAFIAVTPGQSYTISGTRGRAGAAFFSSAGDSAVIAGSYNGTTTLPLTVVAPAGAAFMVINLYSSTNSTYSNVQVEPGALATAYSAYGEASAEHVTTYPSGAAVTAVEARANSLEGRAAALESQTAALLGETTYAPRLVLSGTGNTPSYIEVRRQGKAIRRTFRPFPIPSKTASGVFDFRSDIVDGVAIKSMSDDVAPYRALGTTIGANHGYYMFAVQAVGHGKTPDDIGSVYTNGGTEWVIINIIDANALHIARRSSNASTVAPAGTYTHVSGGTNTGSITVSASGTLAQLYPPFINRAIRCLVDGVQVNETTANMTYSREVAFLESYDIIERADLIAWYEAHGASGGQPIGTPAISVSISYVFDHEGHCTIYTDFLARKGGIPLSDIMFFQAQRMTTVVDGPVEYYIPKALPVAHHGVTYDYANIDSSDTSAWSTRLDFTPARCEPDGILCDRVVQLTNNHGFAMGYLPVQSTGLDQRRLQATAKALQISDSSGKIYLSAIDKGNITLSAGDYYSTIGYRNVLVRTAGRTCCYAVRTNGEDYLYVDWHIAGVDRVPVPADYAGRGFEIVEKSANVSLLSQALTNQLVVDVSSAASYGYLILKVL